MKNNNNKKQSIMVLMTYRTPIQGEDARLLTMSPMSILHTISRQALERSANPFATQSNETVYRRVSKTGKYKQRFCAGGQEPVRTTKKKCQGPPQQIKQ